MAFPPSSPDGRSTGYCTFPRPPADYTTQEVWEACRAKLRGAHTCAPTPAFTAALAQLDLSARRPLPARCPLPHLLVDRGRHAEKTAQSLQALRWRQLGLHLRV
ncbi:unnamed protein product [Prorocentrum cordatum]|uniref:Uncharacterized protein n=1 Tax=Prorocentrum cordatum TaxID=2364126 RepID=A0ABN9TY66_9DINO|nr:unnamed protein product [Polarella glacialis]